MLLRCTGKFLKLLGNPWIGQLADARPSDDDWYANLLRIDGRKCVLLTHAGTLFSIFAPDIVTADLRPPGKFLVSRIEEALAAEELPPWTFGRLDPDSVQLAKTASKVVLGCMNDQAFFCEIVVGKAGGLQQIDIDDLNRRLRRRILGPLGSVYSIELARARLTVD